MTDLIADLERERREGLARFADALELVGRFDRRRKPTQEESELFQLLVDGGAGGLVSDIRHFKPKDVRQ